MRKITISLLTLLFTFTTFGNNLSVSNVTLTGRDVANDFTLVQFDISWDNSWRTSTLESNWDAAWVFVKYRKVNESTWHHATFNYVDGTGSGDGHTEPAGGEIDSDNDDGVGGSHGVFLYANADMAQTSINYTGVQLRWNYGVDGIADDDSVEVCVLGIEMVYIPTGSFDLGDGDGSLESYASFHSGTSNNHVTITTALVGDIRTDNNIYDDAQLESNGVGIDGDGGLDFNDDGTVDNADFPTGYTAFYMMKYEASQEQWIHLYNKLTTSQYGTRNVTATGMAGAWPNKTTTRPNQALDRVSWDDWQAYGDWSAMRPMTELEYEKASRGPVNAYLYEYAWGTTNIHATAYTVTNPLGANESVNSGAGTGNASYQPTDGTINRPLRCGVFAASAPTGGRQETGASYYGVMELSGNVWELVIFLGNSVHRNYIGNHGDGELNSSGLANEGWPRSALNTGGSGTADYNLPLRGGAFSNGAGNNSLYNMRTSQRYFIENYSAYNHGVIDGTVTSVYTIRPAGVGIRLVRTAP
ncbi:MAG: SUMF1/EgtB/PvdO family nonheme iron enzyme [Flavobacteriales bacterium]|nr:SUMF1/EgtB/PvdO family nonheme iron enzyme [Flavobacteriales bacterium]